MQVLIAYGTVEGQTAKIAKHLKARIEGAGHSVVFCNTDDPVLVTDFDGIDRIICAASVHERRHPKAFEAYLAAHRDELNARPTLLVSVSLRAAFPDGQEDAHDYLTELKMRTGLSSVQELLVAGAVKTSAYDYYSQQVLKHVVLKTHEIDPDASEIEFTDWAVLDAKVGEFLAS